MEDIFFLDSEEERDQPVLSEEKKSFKRYLEKDVYVNNHLIHEGTLFEVTE
jgi:hypothetical protein